MYGAVEDENRNALRSDVLSRRNALDHAESALWSGLIQAQALKLPHYLAARSVALYSPIQNEVDTRELLEHALAAGKCLFYPRMISTEEPWLYRVFSPAQLVAGRFGVLEPDSCRRMIETDQKSLVVFVPGVVFDCCGNRLGRGDGWYDRLLARLRGIFIGLAYEFQLVERLAAEKWDRKVQYIITEERVIDCGI